jgi:hypothetical protein
MFVSHKAVLGKSVSISKQMLPKPQKVSLFLVGQTWRITVRVAILGDQKKLDQSAANADRAP